MFKAEVRGPPCNPISDSTMKKLETAYIDSKLRGAISIAESRYSDPVILIIAHPGVAKLLRIHMGAPENADGVKINGYRIFESSRASLHVLVCGEDHESEYDFW